MELQDWIFTLLDSGLALGLALLHHAHVGSFELRLYVHCLDTWEVCHLLFDFIRVDRQLTALNLRKDFGLLIHWHC